MDETESVPEKPSESVTQASGDASSSDRLQTREPVLDEAAEKCESVVKSGSDTNPDISELENEESDLQNHVDHDMSVTDTDSVADLVNNDKDEDNVNSEEAAEESMEVDSQDNAKHCDSEKEEDTQKESEETKTTDSEENQTEDIVKDEIEEDSSQVESQDNNDSQDVISQNITQDQSEKVEDEGFKIDDVKSYADKEDKKDDEVGKPEFETAPNISMDDTQEDHTDALDPFDALLKDNNDTSTVDTETPTTSQAETINALEDDDDDHNVDHVDGEIDEEEHHAEEQNLDDSSVTEMAEEPGADEEVCLLPDTEREISEADKAEAEKVLAEKRKQAEALAVEATVPKEENEAMDTDVASKEDGINSEFTEHVDTSTATEDPAQENGGDKENEIEHEQEESIEDDESLVSNVIQEISATPGMCMQCKQGVPCTYRFTTKDSENNYLCQQDCLTTFIQENPGFTVTCKKYVIEEIMPRFLTCSECEDKKSCYFYYNFDGEDTNYCSLKCLYGMMADERYKYVFKRRRITVEEKTAKEAECSVCNEVKICSYAMTRYGENQLICSTSCIKTLNNNENGRYVIKRKRSQRKTVTITPTNPPLLKLKVISNATDKYLDEAYKIQAKTPAMVQAAREERERTFLRRCNQCSLVLHEDKILTWETMDFCDEVCLGRYQNKIGARCANCQKSVQHTSLGKYCVRFGYDIRQFCNSACLEEFKKGLKICCYCQRDISAGHQGFLAPVGDKGQFKDFCSQLCMEKFDQMSKNPIPQPIWAKCAVCSLEKATAIEIEVNEDVSQRLCSDPCFAAFKFVNNVFPDQCRWCKKYFERKPSKCYTIYEGSSPLCFCSKSCMNVYISNSRHIMPCNWCKVKKYNFDMIKRVQSNGQALMMCSLNCLNLYQVSVNAVSSRSSDEKGCGSELGKGTDRQEQEINPQTENVAVAEPSTRTSEEEQVVVTKIEAVNPKKIKNKDPAVKMEMVTRMRAKELSRTLLPDAPPRKRARKLPSPKRDECRLILGTPSTPPAPKLQPWQLRTKCDMCKRTSLAQYHLTMSDATVRNFCTYQCVMSFQGQYSKHAPPLVPDEALDQPKAVPTGAPRRTYPSASKNNTMSKTQLRTTLPVISNVQSLAAPPPLMPSMTRAKSKRHAATQPPPEPEPPAAPKTPPPPPKPPTPPPPPPPKIYNHVIVKTLPPKEIANKSTMSKPQMVSKGVSCRPHPCTKECQTDSSLEKRVLIPVPVPIYVPVPCAMWSLPFPVPVPIPLPIPVPVFIPTTRNSAKGILKEINKIHDKMPTDPFEAELLMMAEMVAGDKKKDQSDSDTDDDNAEETFSPVPGIDGNNAFGEDMLQMALKMATEYEDQPVDLESAMTANTITPSSHPGMPGLEGESMHHHHMMVLEQQRAVAALRAGAGAGAGAAGVGARKRPPAPPPRPARSSKRRRAEPAPPPQPEPPREPAEKPDANMCLKYTFGVNAWKQWVMTKNAEIEKSSIRRKPFKSEILQLTADELNYSLCLFVKEVRKPNGSEYAPDTIYYLVLGIQQYLFENGRIDNIFTDPYYEKFTDCLDEVARKFSVLYNDSQYIVTRVEEEHLWESKQLGAHSPHVLLSTLMFFNTKHFNLVTVDEHMQLSFSHIMKHWKRNPNQPGQAKVPGSRNVLLRFYPPQSALEANSRKKKVYEQQENEENPLRCPVKLYEFYISKCPESVRTRNDVFYLQPERSCVPDSPVWYSTQPLSRAALAKMLHRVKMVKEINIALLTS